MRRYSVLLIEDEKPLRESIREFLELRECDVLETGTFASAAEILRVSRPEAAVIDHCLPDVDALQAIPRLKAIVPSLPIIVVTGHASVQLAVAVIKAGAAEFLQKPLRFEALFSIIRRSIDSRKPVARQKPGMHDPFLGQSRPIRDLEQTAHKVMTSNRPILIQGETGTGKGVLARWIHQMGPREPFNFVDVNCAGLSSDLLETELFGHERGAFTGAVQRKIGLLEVAHRGTVFLDEIGDVDLRVQSKLLKVLEEQRFHRLGDVTDRHVNIRLIAATHRDLAERVREGSFRADLYYRISTIPLRTPPLRQRPEDIPLLASQFLDNAGVGSRNLMLSPDAIRALQSYSWPGNIRQLRNVIERAALLSDTSTLTATNLHLESVFDFAEDKARGTKTLEQMERQHIAEVLLLEGGRVESAAKTLGIPRSSLYHKIRHYGIGRSGFEGGPM